MNRGQIKVEYEVVGTSTLLEVGATVHEAFELFVLDDAFLKSILLQIHWPKFLWVTGSTVAITAYKDYKSGRRSVQEVQAGQGNALL